MSQSEGADLIALCARGMTGFHHWKLGGVSQHVVRHAVCPVLLLPDPAPGAEPVAPTEQLAQAQRVLVPLDGSPLAETALPPAIALLAALAPQTGALHLLEVVSPFAAEALQLTNEDLLRHANEYLDRQITSLRDIATEQLKLTFTSSAVMDADAAERIMTVAEPEHEDGEDAHAPGYDIIVMATHGHTGMLRWTLGSTTERVLQTTKLPLLIVRPVAV
jgi:nucleotide-binding universal stress UspA family protein